MKIIKIIFINMLILILTLICVEIIGQAVFYMKTGRVLLKGEDTEFIKFHRALYERHPTLGVVLQKDVDITYKDKKVTTLSDRTRPTGAKPADGQIRIALLGGSTTFGTMVSDEESWPAILQSKLGEKYLVKNFGVPGYDSAQTLIQLMLIVSEFKPDIIMFYMGWNDIAHYHVQELGPDFFKGGIKQVETTLSIDFYDYKQSYIDRFFKTSFIGKLTRIIASRLKTYGPKEFKAGRDDPDPFVDRIYRRNLNYLKLVGNSFTPRPVLVFIPQIVNTELMLEREGTNPWSPHINNVSLPGLLKRFNGILAGVCAPNESYCKILREVEQTQWVRDDFADNGHFNDQGGQKFTDVIIQQYFSGNNRI